jgi:NADH-quinone oxidoreductase subunit B
MTTSQANKVYQPLPLLQTDVEQELQQNILVTSVDQVLNWARRSSLWPAMFGLACCAIEMIATATPRYDISRFGAEIFRASPRQADLLIVPGTVTWKMAPAVRRVWLQMPEPKWAIAMGGCATMGGPFAYAYSVTPGVNTLLPVDVYIPGCPPRPEGLLTGLMLLQDKIKTETIANGWVRRDVEPQFHRYLPDGDPIRKELESLWPPYIDYNTPFKGEAFSA